MKWLVGSVIGLVLLLTPVVANCQYIYQRTTAEIIDVAWGDPDETYCEAQVREYPNYPCQMDWQFEIGGIVQESGDTYHIANIGINATHFPFKMGIVGTVQLRLRACDMGEEKCGDWANSNNPDHATVDGQPRGWVVYNKKAPATDLEINKIKEWTNGIRKAANNFMEFTGRQYHYGELLILGRSRRSIQSRS